MWIFNRLSTECWMGVKWPTEGCSFLLKEHQCIKNSFSTQISTREHLILKALGLRILQEIMLGFTCNSSCIIFGYVLCCLWDMKFIQYFCVGLKIHQKSELQQWSSVKMISGKEYLFCKFLLLDLLCYYFEVLGQALTSALTVMGEWFSLVKETKENLVN